MIEESKADCKVVSIYKTFGWENMKLETQFFFFFVSELTFNRYIELSRVAIYYIGWAPNGFAQGEPPPRSSPVSDGEHHSIRLFTGASFLCHGELIVLRFGMSMDLKTWEIDHHLVTRC